MVRFAQGVFGNIDGDRAIDALVALGGYRRYRAVLLTLDRMDVTTPRVYARVVEAAQRLDEELSGRDEQQCGRRVSVVAGDPRARAADARDRRRARGDDCCCRSPMPSIRSRARKTRPFTAITQWMVTTLLDGLPPLVQPDRWTTAKTAYESRFLQALAGPPSDPNAPALTWEGLNYRVDLFAAEHAAPQAHPRTDSNRPGSTRRWPPMTRRRSRTRCWR